MAEITARKFLDGAGLTLLWRKIEDELKTRDTSINSAKTDLEGKISSAKTELNNKIGSVAEGTTLASLIAENASAIEAHKNAIDAKVITLIGSDTNKSVRTIANEELAVQLIPKNAAESLDTLQEIAAWIQDHPGDASAMNAAIEALQKKLVLGKTGTNENDPEYATVKAYVEAVVAQLNGDNSALAERVSQNEAAIGTINGNGDGSIKKALADAKQYTDESLIALTEIEINNIISAAKNNNT